MSAGGCYSVAPCGKCDGCLAIAAMPPWTPDRPTGRDWRTMPRDAFDTAARTVQTALLTRTRPRWHRGPIRRGRDTMTEQQTVTLDPCYLCGGKVVGPTPTCVDCGAQDSQEMPDGLWCAECGTGDATTYVVTFTNGQDDPSGRTEVCRACDDLLRGDT